MIRLLLFLVLFIQSHEVFALGKHDCEILRTNEPEDIFEQRLSSQGWRNEYNEAFQKRFPAGEDINPKDYVNFLKNLSQVKNPRAITLLGDYTYKECFDLNKEELDYEELHKSALALGDIYALNSIFLVSRQEKNPKIIFEGYKIAVKSLDNRIRGRAITYIGFTVLEQYKHMEDKEEIACDLANKSLEFNLLDNATNTLLCGCHVKLIDTNYEKALYYLLLVQPASYEYYIAREELEKRLTPTQVKSAMAKAEELLALYSNQD